MASSAAIILEVRTVLKDTAIVVWTDTEIDYAIIDGFGVVTYGERNESGADQADKALAKQWAQAQLLRGLARDKARFFKWQSAQGTSADKSTTPRELRMIADEMMGDVNKALQRVIDRTKADIKLQGADGLRMDWGKNVASHSDRNYDRRLAKHNKPSDN